MYTTTTTTLPSNRRRTTIRGLLALVIAVVALAGTAHEAQAAPGPEAIRFQQWGRPGSIGYMYSTNLCQQFGTFRSVDAARLEVRESSAYASYTQRVDTHFGLDQWTGTNWVTVAWERPSSQYIPAAQTSVFPSLARSFTVNQPGFYRVVEVVTWYVSNAMVGQARYVFDQDAYLTNGTAMELTSGDGPSACYFGT